MRQKHAYTDTRVFHSFGLPLWSFAVRSCGGKVVVRDSPYLDESFSTVSDVRQRHLPQPWLIPYKVLDAHGQVRIDGVRHRVPCATTRASTASWLRYQKPTSWHGFWHSLLSLYKCVLEWYSRGVEGNKGETQTWIFTRFFLWWMRMFSFQCSRFPSSRNFDPAVSTFAISP